MNLSSEYLRIVLNRMEDAVIIIDKSGQLVTVNNKAEEVLKLRKKDYISKNIDEVIEGSELMRVVETRSEEINVGFSYGKRDFLVDRLPVIVDNQVQGAMAIFHDTTRLMAMTKEIEEDKHYIETLDTIVDTCSEQVVVIDEEGRVKLMSESYKRFLGVEAPEGKHVQEVIENTRLHIVLKTGETEVGDLQMINGNKMIAMRIPIKKEGRVVGAVGKVMFKDISELMHLTEKSAFLDKERALDKPLEKERTAKYSFKSLIGASEAISKVKAMAQKVAKTDSNVLITGESGTGKEVFVHAIHNASLRRNKPFIKINCAAIPSELLESELFGYEEGAFTGAKRGGKRGKVQMAHEGTLLLDEIGDMPLEMQAKLLRVIQDKAVEKVGGEGVEHVDVRIMASTNKDLSAMVKAQTFRQDLYYRLDVMNIHLPALRDRVEDIPILSRELCYIIGNRLGRYVGRFSDEVMAVFKAYQWPGNIRELENVIERAINLIDTDAIIKVDHLPDHLQGYYKKGGRGQVQADCNLNLKMRVEALEKETISQCLKQVGYNKNQAAKILNISRVSLYNKIEKYDL